MAIDQLRSALLVGGMLVIAVLFLFLLNLCMARISAVAIPLSLLTAVIMLRRLGVSLNTMTLGSLAIALGEVVDDAIIDEENIIGHADAIVAINVDDLPAAGLTQYNIEVQRPDEFSEVLRHYPERVHDEPRIRRTRLSCAGRRRRYLRLASCSLIEDQMLADAG